MKCHIFTGPKNYNIQQLFQKNDGDYVIGADQGALFLAELGIHFDLAIGDFDSVLPSDIELIKKHADTFKEFPIKKNFTDTFLAVQEAWNQGAVEIVLYGGVGQRFDHTYANVLLLEMGNITMVNDSLKMYVLSPGTYDILNSYQYVSFFAVEDVKNLSLQGFLYDVEDITLPVGDPLCVSNQQEGTVSFTNGKLLVIHQNER